MRPLLRGAIAAVALSLAPVAVITSTMTPADAAVSVDTRTTFQKDVRKNGVAGGAFIVSGEVRTINDPDGYGPLAGVSHLQRQAPGSRAWKNVGTDDSPGFSYFPEYDTYTGNAKFRIYYTGGTYGAGTSGERTYPPSVSKAISIKVRRTMTFKDVSRGAKGRGQFKVGPKYAQKKLLVQTKRAGRFTTVRTARTNRRGTATIPFRASPSGITYRIVARGDKQFVTTSLKVTYRRY